MPDAIHAGASDPNEPVKAVDPSDPTAMKRLREQPELQGVQHLAGKPDREQPARAPVPPPNPHERVEPMAQAQPPSQNDLHVKVGEHMQRHAMAYPAGVSSSVGDYLKNEAAWIGKAAFDGVLSAVEEQFPEARAIVEWLRSRVSQPTTPAPASAARKAGE